MEIKAQLSLLLTTLKSSWVKMICIISAFLLPIKPLLLIVGICIGLDTIIGIYRAKKRKEKITSRKLSQVVGKMVLYQSAVVLFYAIEKYILVDFINIFINIELFLTKIVAITLVSVELKSIDESIKMICGKSLWDYFKELLSRTKEIKGELEELKNNN